MSYAYSLGIANTFLYRGARYGNFNCSWVFVSLMTHVEIVFMHELHFCMWLSVIYIYMMESSNYKSSEGIKWNVYYVMLDF
jgi:hypothetical protein